MTQDKLKQQAAVAALDYVEDDMVVGVGTGSTANFFIDALAERKHRILTTVASSKASAVRLKANGISVWEIGAVDEIHIYVDGADEATEHRHLIKGGGGALTREKIVAQSAKQFVCIVDQSKMVKTLGAFPLPIEVIPMARGLVARALFSMGANPFWREGFVTDNGNQILDVHNLTITEPAALESELNHMVGAVTNGLFARRPADVILCAEPDGIKRI